MGNTTHSPSRGDRAIRRVRHEFGNDRPAFRYRSGSVRLALLLILVTVSAVFANAAHACSSGLTGRALVIDPGIKSFGAVQKQPPLDLRAGEYVLTIDDGPNPRTTEALLAILRSRCVSATFFLVGRNAMRNPELVRKIANSGSAIASHSYSHADFGKLSRQAMADEVWNGVQAVEMAAMGHAGRPGIVRLFRFPGSASMPPVLPPGLVAMANGIGVTVAGYDFSPEDWRNSPPAESYRRLMSRLGDRGVILFHDGQPNTIELLPMVLDELAKRNGRIVALKTAE